MRFTVCAFLLLLAAPAVAAPVDFRRDILPLFERRCAKCHGQSKAQGGLRVDKIARLKEGGISGTPFVPGDPKKSYLVQRLRGEGGEDQMPLKAKPFTEEQIALVERWITDGAVLPEEPPAVFAPPPAGMKRLTLPQYKASIRELLGPRVALPGNLEADTRISGSAAVAAARIPLSARATELLSTAARRLAGEAIADPDWRARWLPCAPGFNVRARPEHEPCLDQFLRGFGRRTFRRPLSGDEHQRYGRLGRAPRFWAGVTRVVTAMLQSPHFLYRIEVGVPDPNDRSRRALTDFELASRLSFFLWGGPPDDALLDAAEAGRLSTAEGLRAEAERLLDSPRVRQTMLTFFSELLRLHELERLPQFRSAFAKVSSALGTAMRDETLKLVEEFAFDGQRDFRELFDTHVAYVNRELAALYGLEAPRGKGLERVELPPDSPRVGLLTRASFLALNAHPTTSSPSKRGKFIREVLLCQAVPPPPPNVSATLPEGDDENSKLTTRQKLGLHRTSPQCAGCHKSMDPIGLTFETFDGLGAHRTTEHGLPIDPRGELDGVPFSDAAALGRLLRASSRVPTCLARNLFRFALGHLETDGEEPIVEEITRGFAADGYRFRALVFHVFRSPAFRYVSEPAPPALAAR